MFAIIRTIELGITTEGCLLSSLSSNIFFYREVLFSICLSCQHIYVLSIIIFNTENTFDLLISILRLC